MSEFGKAVEFLPHSRGAHIAAQAAKANGVSIETLWCADSTTMSTRLRPIRNMLVHAFLLLGIPGSHCVWDKARPYWMPRTAHEARQRPYDKLLLRQLWAECFVIPFPEAA